MKKISKIDLKSEEDGGIRLNKYVASCGVGSRRTAAEWVKEGLVKVNGVLETNPAILVQKNDIVSFRNKKISPEVKTVYYLMNKPKDTITTLKDERGRKTVMDIIKPKIKERIFPVGRLDRNTTGLLLLTNDGALAQKLSHPKYKIKKIYHAFLNRPLSPEDLESIRQGLVLEDGVAKVDGISYVDGKSKNEVGLEIHIGKNRIVRRIFEHLNYRVERLDRVYYAGLTKKDISRGRFRKLTEKEVIMLKHFV